MKGEEEITHAVDDMQKKVQKAKEREKEREIDG